MVTILLSSRQYTANFEEVNLIYRSWTKVNLALSLMLLIAFVQVYLPFEVKAEDSQETIVEEAKFREVSTPHYNPYESNFEPRFGVYTYEVSWNGIPAAEAKLSVGGDEFQYRLIATARTYSPVNIFYNLKYQAEGILSAIDFSPIRTVIRQRENSKVRMIDINFNNDGAIESVRTQEGKPTKILRFSSDNPTLDPFAAAFMARTLSWKEGETKQFDTFNGKTRYLITLTAQGRENIEFNGQEKDCWVITPKVEKLVDGESPSKLRDARIYLTNDSNRDVVRIESEVFIGTVVTKLKAFHEEYTPPVIRMAALRGRSAIR